MKKIIGFDNELNSLLDNLNHNNLNNSVLLCGNKGIGKSLFLFNLLKEYIKIKFKDDQIKHHINLLYNNSHPNIKFLKKEIDEKSKKIKNFITIDQIRKSNQFFIETSIIDNFPKFIIVDSADDLNLNAANALLKILEEPKINTFFFLISHQPSSLLPTIKSRCLKINLLNHDFNNFKMILNSNNSNFNDETIEFLFDITNGAPGLTNEFDTDEILNFFKNIIFSLVDPNPFSDLNLNLINILSKYENDKFKIYLFLIKFILITISKIKIGIDIKKTYLSKNIINIEKVSHKISKQSIQRKLDYLINNENDLFTFNLDKKVFMINLIAEI